MRILMAHNFYQYPGGEDQVFAAEAALLEDRGHTVVRMTRHNDDVRGMSRMAVARAALWNRDSYRQVAKLVRDERIDVAHFHNTFPLISPAAYYAARARNVPVVQTLHNYRLVCPGSLLYREGRVCEDCLTRAMPWPGILHSCYRNSFAQSAVVAGMLTLHRTTRTWSNSVDTYIALTEFARNKFIEGGLPARKIIVKPNFLAEAPGPKPVPPAESGASYALYVGRLAEDKGVNVLLRAWRKLEGGISLKVAGDGPLLDRVTREAKDLRGVEILGPLSRAQVLDRMKAASVLIFPSLWYEGLPMTIVEAYAAGLPVIASNLGGMRSIVEEGRTGAHFQPGHEDDLAEVVRRVVADPEKLAEMRANARRAYERKYSPERNYTELMGAYDMAARSRSARSLVAKSPAPRILNN